MYTYEINIQIKQMKNYFTYLPVLHVKQQQCADLTYMKM